ncbi:MAG: TIM barrel protein [Deinococcota bacterium]
MAQLIPGVCSVTFRQLPAEEVIALVKQAGLTCIEWGGDVHVPHGDSNQARHIRDKMDTAQLTTAAYGSYYRVAESEAAGLTFADVLETAVCLGAPTVRVWAGSQGSDQADKPYVQQVVEDTRRIADLAAAQNISVSFEFHRNTLTDTNEAALELLQACNHTNLYSFWQPPHYTSQTYRAEGLRALLPQLTNVHVFNWPEPGVRRPLAEASAPWQNYLEIVASSSRVHPVLLEFVDQDSQAAFLKDAKTLLGWLDDLN